MAKFNQYLILLVYIFIATLLAVVPCAIDSLIQQGSGPENKFRILEYGVSLLLFFSIPLFIQKCKTIRIALPEIAAVLLILYFLIRAAVDPNQGYAFDYALQTVSWITFALIVSSLVTSPKIYIRLLSAALICQLFPIIYAIVETFGVDIYFRYWRETEGFWRSALASQERALIWSSLGNPNYFAIYAALVLLALFTLLSVAKKRWIQIVLLIYSCGVFYTIIYSFSRGVWVSMAGSLSSVLLFLALYFCIHTIGMREALKQYSRYLLIGGASLVFCIMIGYNVESIRGGGPLHQVGKRFYHGITFRDASLRARPLMWSGALRMWRDQPLTGQGHGQYQPQYLESLFTVASEMEEQGIDTQKIRMITSQMNTIRSDYSHNDYVQFLAETGIIGYSLYVLMVLSTVSAGIYALWAGALPPLIWRLLLGCLASVMLVTFHCLYDFPLRLPSSALWFAFALAGVLRLSKKYLPTIAITNPLYVRIPIVAVFILYISFTLPLILKHYKSSHLLFRGIQVIEKADHYSEMNPDRYYTRLQYARRLLEEAHQLYPENGRIMVPLGLAYMRLSASVGETYLNNAMSYLQQARATYNTPELYETLGLVYLNKAMFSAAKEQADKLLLINDRQKGVNYLAGLVEYSSNRPQAALNYFNKEIQVDPKNAEAWSYIGAIYQDSLENSSAAINAYEKSIGINPNVVNTQFQLGELYAYKLNQNEKALTYYAKAQSLAEQLKNEKWRTRIRVRIQDVNRRIAAESE